MRDLQTTTPTLRLGAASEKSAPEDEPYDGVAAAIRNYRRGPPDAKTWLIVSEAEFPWFGMAEVMLHKSDDELAATWRDLPEEAQKSTTIFEKIGLRWLDGAEAMTAMMNRMMAARDSVKAERKGDEA
jgi:hypothetical protein